MLRKLVHRGISTTCRTILSTIWSHRMIIIRKRVLLANQARLYENNSIEVRVSRIKSDIARFLRKKSTWSGKKWYWPRSSQHLLLGIYHSILIVMKVRLSWLSRNGPVGVTFLFLFSFWFQIDNHLYCSRLQFQGHDHQRENFFALSTAAAFSVPLSPLCKAVFGIAPGQ